MVLLSQEYSLTLLCNAFKCYTLAEREELRRVNGNLS